MEHCENTFHIRNMVCDRCIWMVQQLLEESGFTPRRIELGWAEVCEHPSREQREAFARLLERYGFELLDDPQMRIVEQIRTAVIEWVHYLPEERKGNFSDFVSERCHRDYSSLSKLFSSICHMTVEKYLLAQRIERVKELLADDELTVSEIADLLHYSSVGYLSRQFRAETGMSPSEFRRSGIPMLKPLDKV